MKSRYRLLSVQRERISVRWPGVKSPRGPFVAITPLIFFHSPEFGSAVNVKSEFVWKLLIVFESSWAVALIAQRQNRTVAIDSSVCLFINSPRRCRFESASCLHQFDLSSFRRGLCHGDTETQRQEERGGQGEGGTRG